jgi:hypothetical protein
VTESEASQTLVEVLRSDHRAISAELADPVAAAPGDAGATARVELVMGLVRHFVAEEQHLYPALRARVEGGEALAEEEFTAARACEAELRRLEAHDVTADQLAGLLAGIARRFAEHVAHQDETAFPRLEAAANRVELVELGAAALGTEQLAPTRPRHLASENPGVNRLAGLVEGFVDRLRDFYTARGVRPGGDDRPGEG